MKFYFLNLFRVDDSIFNIQIINIKKTYKIFIIKFEKKYISINIYE